MKPKKLLERHPVLTYFVLVFVLTWGAVLLVAPSLPAPDSADSTTRVAILSIPMLIFPGLTAVGLTLILEGREGLRTMLAPLRRWQVETRWYAVSLFLMPFLVLAILRLLSTAISPAYTPILSLLGLAGIAAGFLEEIGWTGFAVPRLLGRWRPLLAGLVVGLLWALWHGAADYAIRGETLAGFWPITFALFVIPLVAWRMLMVWVYDNCRSLFVAQLMHFSYTGSLALFVPALERTEEALVYLLLVVALWVAVAILAVSQQRETPPVRPQIKPAG